MTIWRYGLLIAVLSVFFLSPGLAQIESAAPAGYGDQSKTIQFDVKAVLNARAVTTIAQGKLIPWSTGIDEKWSGLATRLAADAMGNATEMALPDDGTFPASGLHPLAVLNFSNADTSGNQVRFSAKNRDDSYAFEVPENYYSVVSLFFMSAFGQSDFLVEIGYADHSSEVEKYSLGDWANKSPEDQTRFFLCKNLAKWGQDNKMLEKDSHYLAGINVQPQTSKKVVKIAIKKPASGTTLTFWGAVGYLGAEGRTVAGDAREISYEGRTVRTAAGTVRLGYPGVITRVNFRGTSLRMHGRTASDELYLDLGVDGAAPVCLQVPKGESDIVLAHDLIAGTHHVEIFKRIESCVGVLEVISFCVDGEFLPATPLPTRRLMFLGDSFTAGQATTVEEGGRGDASKAKRENARLSYGRLLADRLHAQCHLIAYAGRGVVRDWQGITAVRCAPEYYEYALPDDPGTAWNPQTYVPEAIGVCLGNNDFDAGVPDEVAYVAAYAEFVRKLRRDAPQAFIFLILSPNLTDEPGRVPKRSVQRAYLEEVVNRLGDARIQVVPIAHYQPVPGDGHPSGTAHRAIADELEPVFRKALQW